MKILHYSLGFPPLRSGGLTEYSVSLMKAQVAQGDDVYLLFPSTFLCKTNLSKIKRFKQTDSIQSYKLKTTSIIPLLHGVRNPNDILYSSDLSTKSIELFIEEVKPQIFHVHTWMGISMRLLRYIASKDIKIVFSTHDYFGLCFRVNFINNDGIPCSESIRDCTICNSNSLNKYFLYFRNNYSLLPLLKGSGILSALLKRIFSSQKQQKQKNKITSANYLALYGYYQELFKLVDGIHFNSSHTEKIFRTILPNLKGEVILITHGGIVDLRHKINFNNDQSLQMFFIGSEEPYKGLPQLLDGLETLNTQIKNWTLHIYGNTNRVQTSSSKIIYHGSYSKNEINNVFKDKHLLVLPSICNETFGFVALEAISRGIPVLVSDTVGAKDIVAKYAPDFICPSISEMTSKINAILHNRELLSEYNQKIIDTSFDYLMTKHVSEIKRFYNSIL